jgi:hypothetical protein
MAEPRKVKAQGSNAYTALLGMAALALAVASGVAAYYSQIVHESLFKVTGN